ncbi:MAG: YdeI/OmpD-associated family protein [Cyclobacteriaceae bacterium]
MKQIEGENTYYAQSSLDWRKWLERNGDDVKSIWLIIYHKGSSTSSVTYPEAVDDALCYGWVDSTPNKRDHESYYQLFAKRNPKSNWSRVNKEKVARMIKKRQMTKAGHEMIAIAKENGTWTALDDVENLIIPGDLQQALADNRPAEGYFEAFPKSVKRGILEWIFNAQRAETRKKRIDETATLAKGNIRANQYQK